MLMLGMLSQPALADNGKSSARKKKRKSSEGVHPIPASGQPRNPPHGDSLSTSGGGASVIEELRVAKERVHPGGGVTWRQGELLKHQNHRVAIPTSDRRIC